MKGCPPLFNSFPNLFLTLTPPEKRYQEGRKMWTNITIASRNLASMVCLGGLYSMMTEHFLIKKIWIHVPNTRPPAIKQTVLESIIEKKTMVNLVSHTPSIHFFLASDCSCPPPPSRFMLMLFQSKYLSKVIVLRFYLYWYVYLYLQHSLREENGVYYEDLYPLISFLPRNTTGTTGAEGGDRLPLWRMREDSDNVEQPPTSQQSFGSQPTSPISRGSSSNYFTERDDKQLPQIPPNTSDPEGNVPLPTTPDHPLKPARNPPLTSIYDYVPLLRLIRWLIRKMLRLTIPVEKRKKKKKKGQVEIQIPLEIFLVLSKWESILPAQV